MGVSVSVGMEGYGVGVVVIGVVVEVLVAYWVLCLMFLCMLMWV